MYKFKTREYKFVSINLIEPTSVILLDCGNTLKHVWFGIRFSCSGLLSSGLRWEDVYCENTEHTVNVHLELLSTRTSFNVKKVFRFI